MNWLGLDIGGANIKISDGREYARSEPFALWREPGKLCPKLHELIAMTPGADALAVTMTGELADCFRTKSEGVRAIVDAVVEVAGARRVRIYLTDGTFAPPGVAVDRYREAAASNWHALATVAAGLIDGERAVLIDVGSTTTDIVPIVEGRITAVGKDDTSRLASGELVYTGVRRTPLAAIVDWLPWHDERVPVAAEAFATSLDAYLWLGEIAESLETDGTADGRAATREAARDRLARMICADREVFSEEDALVVAQYVCQCQTAAIGKALLQVSATLGGRPTHGVISGSGEFLARLVAQRMNLNVASMSEAIGSDASACAAAYAVATLAAKEQSA
ncbi:MAG: hypothetical protein MI757_08800 [Pirellulales bacterium]|nr:hypothetical protein [Pirellulales bacterium]